ncbi:recombinase RecT [Pectinatus frisingensis]|uniref:recombinase RecT n=1 Tax=Pectinatus frisingensis TaxID=865 RepID=UPI0018C847FE|nr:recombinase RecT [Pectinatus frisingensis]
MQTAVVRNDEKMESVARLFDREDVKTRFEKVLGDDSPVFISSLISLVNSSNDMQACTRASVLAAAMTAATLKLPINPNLGFAYIIPYKHKDKSGKVIEIQAQFQMGYKGYIQLAMRTGKYKALTVNEVLEGEITSFNRFTDVMTFGQATSDKVVGYMAYFKLVNGFEKYLYWTIEKVKAHGQKYSFAYRKGYKDCLWITDFDSMAKKTVIKQLISKYGIMSVELQNGLENDIDGVGIAQRAGLKVVSDMEANKEEIAFDEPEGLPEADHSRDINMPAFKEPQEEVLPRRAF